MAGETDYLVEAGRVLWTRDRLASLGAQLAAGVGLQSAPAREVAALVNSGELDRAEKAQQHLSEEAR